MVIPAVNKSPLRGHVVAGISTLSPANSKAPSNPDTNRVCSQRPSWRSKQLKIFA